MQLSPYIPHPYASLVPKMQEFFPQAVYESALKQFNRIEDTLFERITYESDGLNITGALATPKEVPTDGLPIIIFCRGGYSNYGILTPPVMLRMFHRFTQRGYIVVGSNYRGNDGSDGRDDFGGDDVHDVVALRQQLDHIKHWDGKNVFLFGWSRGGMMAYRALQEGLQANAAASIAGIANIELLAKDSPHLEERILKNLSFADGHEESIAAEYAHRSATNWAETLTTPLLLLHGTNDVDVPHSHSVALAEALQQHGQPHQLTLFEDGDHTLKKHKKETDDAVVSWFKQHIQ